MGFCKGTVKERIYDMGYNELTPEEERVIVHKATEPPFTGEYDNFYKQDTYVCRTRTEQERR
jgi:peptide methionine sulfoxide reductase MsrB